MPIVKLELLMYLHLFISSCIVLVRVMLPQFEVSCFSVFVFCFDFVFFIFFCLSLMFFLSNEITLAILNASVVLLSNKLDQDRSKPIIWKPNLWNNAVKELFNKITATSILLTHYIYQAYKFVHHNLRWIYKGLISGSRIKTV